MKITDALSILGLNGQYNPDIIKAAYRKACSQYHPDRNPSGLEMMKMVNQAYDLLKDLTGSEQVSADYNQQYGEYICAALNKIIDLGLDIEVCGAWIWLHGDTRPHKELIKESGFMWAPKKKLWYYRPSDYKSNGRGQSSMDEIREKHGSQKVYAKERTKLKAA